MKRFVLLFVLIGVVFVGCSKGYKEQDIQGIWKQVSPIETKKYFLTYDGELHYNADGGMEYSGEIIMQHKEKSGKAAFLVFASGLWEVKGNTLTEKWFGGEVDSAVVNGTKKLSRDEIPEKLLQSVESLISNTLTKTIVDLSATEIIIKDKSSQYSYQRQ